MTEPRIVGPPGFDIVGEAQAVHRLYAEALARCVTVLTDDQKRYAFHVARAEAKSKEREREANDTTR